MLMWKKTHIRWQIWINTTWWHCHSLRGHSPSGVPQQVLIFEKDMYRSQWRETIPFEFCHQLHKWCFSFYITAKSYTLPVELCIKKIPFSFAWNRSSEPLSSHTIGLNVTGANMAVTLAHFTAFLTEHENFNYSCGCSYAQGESVGSVRASTISTRFHLWQTVIFQTDKHVIHGKIQTGSRIIFLLSLAKYGPMVFHRKGRDFTSLYQHKHQPLNILAS